MLKLSNPNILNFLTKLLIIIALAKSISLVFLWILPSDGVDFKEKMSYKPIYHRIDFKDMLENEAIKKQKKVTNIQKPSIGITNMILKGLYGKGSKGFAIVALKSSPGKTSIVSVGENFSGYILKSIFKDGVVFTKMGKEYILRMKTSKAVKNSIKSFSRVEQNIDEGVKKVSRQDINFYIKHPKKVWQDIAIMEVKNGNKIKGFKVMNINKNSKISELGLKKGDLIIKANNIELNSYKSVINIYNNINKLDAIDLVVLRGNEEKELVYEIH